MIIFVYSYPSLYEPLCHPTTRRTRLMVECLFVAVGYGAIRYVSGRLSESIGAASRNLLSGKASNYLLKSYGTFASD